MDRLNPLAGFFSKASKDSRIGIAHIGLYATLLQIFSLQGFEGPIIIYGITLMHVAKISSTATYHKLIKDLNDFGYIRYEPSFNRRVGSCIYIN